MEMLRRIVQILEPRRIIAVGLRTFDELNDGKPNAFYVSGRRTWATSHFDGRKLPGVLHISGGWLTESDNVALVRKLRSFLN